MSDTMPRARLKNRSLVPPDRPEGAGESFPLSLPALTLRLDLGQWLLLGLGLLLVGFLTLMAVPGYDLWWQLATGKLIVKSGSVPNADVFSFSSSGRPWLVQEWVTEVLFYFLYTHAPAVTLVGFKMVTITAALGLLFWRCWLRTRNFLLSLGLMVLGAYGAQYFFDIRPQAFTYLYLSLLLLLLEGHRMGRWPRAIYAVPPLILLWVNCHAGFLLGLTILIAELGGEAATALVEGRRSCPRLRRLAIVTGLSMLAGLCNPSGIGAYLYPFPLLMHKEMLDSVAEWLSPDFHKAWVRGFELVILGLVFALGASRGRRVLQETVLAVALLHASLFSYRHMPVFVLYATPIIAYQLGTVLSSVALWLRERHLGGGRAAAMVLAAVVLLFCISRQWRDVPKQNLFAHQIKMDLFPKGACDFLERQQGWDHRLLNEYAWGGYCIWRLAPKYQVFIDGRAEVYFDTSFIDYSAIFTLSPGWEGLMDKWGFQTVLMPRMSKLARRLVASRKWQAAYSDDLAVVLRRKPAVKS